MSQAVYAMLSRQQGLVHEMQSVANNIANASTSGYKSDRALFVEYLVGTGADNPSLSMGGLGAHTFDLSAGGLESTGGPLDLAVNGEGYFAVQSLEGQRLTRAGHFQLSSDGLLITADGLPVLSAGGGPIIFPPDAASISIGADGSISVDGEPLERIGVFRPAGDLLKEAGTLFSAPGGYALAEEATLVQGALEQSNVVPVIEIARMIDVQRAYDAGQSLLEAEDGRVSQIINALRER